MDKETAAEILKQTEIIQEALRQIVKLADGKDHTITLLACQEFMPVMTIADHAERVQNGHA